MIKERRFPKLNKVIGFTVAGVVIVGAFILLAFFIMGGQGQDLTADDYHAAQEEGKPIVVDFVELTTTAEEYDILYQACEEHIRSGEYVQTDAETEALVDISEDTFVDGGEPAPGVQSETSSDYTEYDRAYFENMLVIRYVNQSGLIQVVGARFDSGNGGSVELLDLESFEYDHFNNIPWGNWNELLQLAGILKESDMVSEQVYVTCVGQCVSQLLIGERDAETVLSHFTAEGELALLRISQVLGIDSDSTVTVNLSAAAKSDLSKETMDRLYLRCEITGDETVSYVNLLLKLNGNMLIFDVDIV